jgi:splicing factor 3A subunit 2
MGAVAPQKPKLQPRKTIKIGRPGYRVTKQRDPDTQQRSLLFEIEYPEIEDGLQPRQRFMSAYEQHKETPDKRYQYLLVAAEPYETIGFKIPNKPIDKGEGKFWSNWNRDTLTFSLQLCFALDEEAALPQQNPAPATSHRPMVDYARH